MRAHLPRRALCTLPILLALTGCSDRLPAPYPPLPVLEESLSRLIELDREPPPLELPAWSTPVLQEAGEAVRLLDRIFWEQSFPGGWEMHAELAASDGSWERKAAALLWFHAGPFDRLRGMEPFLDVGPRPPGGGLWPPFATRQGIGELVVARPELEAAILDPRTVVRLDGEEVAAIPFAEAYAAWLRPAAAHLRRATALAGDDGAAAQLMACADAIESGGGCGLDPEAGGLVTILGPLDPREDRLLGRKVAYVAMLGWVLGAETDSLGELLAGRAALLRHLPEYPERPEAVPAATMVVADELRRGGAPAHGVQPVSWTESTPDGSSTVLWRDRIDARRQAILEPLADRLLEEDQRPLLTAEGYFHLIRMRELGRGLVPRGGALESAAVLEEAAAAAVGLHSTEWFVRRGILPASLGAEQQVAHLVELLATIRAEADSPRARAALIALNWHREQGAITHDPETERFRVEPDRMGESATALAAAVLAAEAAADPAAARGLLAGYGTAGPEIRGMLGRTGNLPLEVRIHREK